MDLLTEPIILVLGAVVVLSLLLNLFLWTRKPKTCHEVAEEESARSLTRGKKTTEKEKEQGGHKGGKNKKRKEAKEAKEKEEKEKEEKGKNDKGKGKEEKPRRGSLSKENIIPAAIAQHFPHSLDQRSLVVVIQNVLEHVPSLEGKKYLLATSCCPDEINRDLDSALVDVYGRAFSMGGLAGIPFVGDTGFGAFAAHVPNNGCLVIFSASHIGFNHENGKMGKIMREGLNNETTSCGAAAAAYSYCCSHTDLLEAITKGDRNAYKGFCDDLDQQQNFILKFVASHFEEIHADAEPQVKLANIVADKIQDYLNKMLPDSPLPVVHIHGIQVNIEGAEDIFEDDYFCVKSFDLIQNGKRNNLMPDYMAERKHYLTHQTAKFSILLNQGS